MAAPTSPLSTHILCGEGPPSHEAIALCVLVYSLPVSHRPEDGTTDHLLALCGHPACEASAIRSTPSDAILEPVRDLTVEDLHEWFGVEADVARPTSPATWYEVEVIGQSCRYAGSDFAAAVHAVCSIGEAEEGFAVATVNGSYSPAESDRVETAATSALFGAS